MNMLTASIMVRFRDRLQISVIVMAIEAVRDPTARARVHYRNGRLDEAQAMQLLSDQDRALALRRDKNPGLFRPVRYRLGMKT